MDAIAQFKLAMGERRIIPPSEIIADGNIHRCDAEGKNGHGDAAYLLHLDRVPAGGMENHRDGRGWENWCADLGRSLTVDEEHAFRARASAQRAQREQEEVQRRAETRSRAKAIWEVASGNVGLHPYLATKGVGAHKTRVMTEPLTIAGMDCVGSLIVPMRDADGNVCQLQFISPDGKSKRFLPGPKAKGLYFLIGNPTDVVCVAEGFATAASIHEATGYAVAVAFDCGGLSHVARVLRDKFPTATIIVCADDDYLTHGNPGRASGASAAKLVGALLAVPDFGGARPEGASDFNDLGRIRGPGAIKRIVDGAVLVAIPPTLTTTATGIRAVAAQSPPSKVANEPMAGLVCAATIAPEAVQWLWDGWLAVGKLQILAGAPGAGKTTVALDFAATVSSGGRWPDDSRARQGHVLIWSAEDDATDTLVPRLIAMGADLSRVHIITTADDGDGIRSFDPARDVDQLRNAIRHLEIFPSLIIIDPIISAVAGDSHKGNDTRRSLQPLVDLGVELRCAVLGITHFSKGTAGRDVLERVTGSLAFGALARVVLVAAKTPDDQGGGRFIARAKSNLGPDGDGFRYELKQQSVPGHPELSASALQWGEAILGNARDILAQAEVTVDADTKAQTDEAQELLRDLLSNGPLKAAAVFRKGKAAGISEKSIRTAGRHLGISIKKQDFAGGWVWALPGSKGAGLSNRGRLSTREQRDKDSQPTVIRQLPEGTRLSEDAQDAQPQRSGILGILGVFGPVEPAAQADEPSDTEYF